MEALLELKKDYCQNVKIEISFLYLFHLFMYKFYYKFNIICIKNKDFLNFFIKILYKNFKLKKIQN